MEDSGQTQTQSKKGGRKVEAPDDNLPVIEASMELIDDAKGPEVSSDKMINNDLDGMHDDFDTTNFHEEVNADMGEDLAIDYSGDEVIDSDDHVMSPIMDVLQT